MIKEIRPGRDCSSVLAALAVFAAACTSGSATSTAPSAAAPSVAASEGAPSEAAPSAAADPVQDRLLERWRRRQRLPRGAGLHRQGRGRVIRPGLRAHHHPPQHGRRRPAPGHPRPDRQRTSTRSSSTRTTRPRSTRRSPRPRPPASRPSRSTRYVTDPDTYNLYNNQVKYAELGANWLFEQLGGKGNVYYMRGIAGNPADTDRDTGFKNVLEDYPDIKVVPTAKASHTDWDPAKATQAGQRVHRQRRLRRHPGHLDVRHGLRGRRRHQGRRQAVRADRRRRPRRVRQPAARPTRSIPGLKGAAVTNTAAVGGAGVGLALKLLNGETHRDGPGGRPPNTVLLDPVARRQHDGRGQGASSRSGRSTGSTRLWPLGLQIEG